jgi:hypothetical protein
MDKLYGRKKNMSKVRDEYNELFAWYKPEENTEAPNWMKVVYNRMAELENENLEMKKLLHYLDFRGGLGLDAHNRIKPFVKNLTK